MAVQTGVRIAQKPVGIITVPAMELPTEDGEPLETSWHRSEINLLIEMVRVHWRGRQDFYAGGNLFIYYSLDQARKRDYRGPDFFVARGVDGSYSRQAWVVWEEGGKYPDVIIELLSESTAKEDLTTKKGLYERVFRTGEYFCYDPDTHELRGWRLVKMRYEEIKPSERGWLLSEQLGVWLGL
jgi:Uma2 family endonuclease